MQYCDLEPAQEAYKRGENVTEVLRRLLGTSENTPEIIEIAYDLQAGTYIEYVKNEEAAWLSRTSEMARVLMPLVTDASSIAEIGAGELTSLVGVANACYPDSVSAYACDLSWSRICKGRAFADERLRGTLQRGLTSFVADLFRLPFQDAALDIVWTSHALEPNGGREREALRELLRVAKRYVVLFEPSYEKNSAEGRARMERLGYVRGLPEAVLAEGGQIVHRQMMHHVANPLNPTEAIVIRPAERLAGAGGIWACPSTRLPMDRRQDFYWSSQSMLAYPIVGGIPVLRRESAILATAVT